MGDLGAAAAAKKDTEQDTEQGRFVAVAGFFFFSVAVIFFLSFFCSIFSDTRMGRGREGRQGAYAKGEEMVWYSKSGRPVVDWHLAAFGGVSVRCQSTDWRSPRRNTPATAAPPALGTAYQIFFFFFFCCTDKQQQMKLRSTSSMVAKAGVQIPAKLCTCFYKNLMNLTCAKTWSSFWSAAAEAMLMASSPDVAR